ncbi:MAG: hypothetical protein ACRDQH_06930 [Pseudonocardiaceae bacterium]
MTLSGRNYYEVYLLLLTLGWAIMSWIIGDGESIDAVFPAWGRYVFFGGLILASTSALVGIALGTLTGLLLERAAMFSLAGLCGCFAIVVAFGADLAQGLYVVPLLATYAAVHYHRAGQVRRDIDRTRAQLRAMGEAP